MVLGLAGALAAAVCYGVASVLQAVAAARSRRTEGLDPRLVLRLLGSWAYVVGLVLDALGFLLSVAALQGTALFVVQAVVAASLAVTAAVAAVVLRLRLSALDRLGLASVLTGLVLLALSAAGDRTVTTGRVESWGVLAAAGLLGLAAVPAGRSRGRSAAPVLGAVAGLAFGDVAVAARLLPLRGHRPGDAVGVLVADPATYAVLAAGAVALVVYATALQRGSVLSATAPMVVTETVVPALVGLLVLGDRARPGWAPAAGLGFALAVAGALALARHGEVDATGRPHSQPSGTSQVPGAQ